jgi:uncharacterized damage-inducible protein DinB
MTRTIIQGFEAEFRKHRRYAEEATGQLPWELLRVPLDPETNSIAVIMKHLGGNLRSRWTDALTTDGEKPWRNRDTEFVDDFADRAAMDVAWRAGWDVLEQSLATFTDEDLGKTLKIRGEPHTLALALTRSLAHAAYHAGQIVMIARVLASKHGLGWKVLTIARGQSAAFNARMGFEPAKRPSGA